MRPVEKIISNRSLLLYFLSCPPGQRAKHCTLSSKEVFFAQREVVFSPASWNSQEAPVRAGKDSVDFIDDMDKQKIGGERK